MFNIIREVGVELVVPISGLVTYFQQNYKNQSLSDINVYLPSPWCSDGSDREACCHIEAQEKQHQSCTHRFWKPHVVCKDRTLC